MHGLPRPIITPQCFSGSNSRSFTGNTFRFLRLVEFEYEFVVDLLIDELSDELLLDDELIPLKLEDMEDVDIDFKFDDVSCIELLDIVGVIPAIPIFWLINISSLFNMTCTSSKLLGTLCLVCLLSVDELLLPVFDCSDGGFLETFKRLENAEANDVVDDDDDKLFVVVDAVVGGTGGRAFCIVTNFDPCSLFTWRIIPSGAIIWLHS